MSVLRIETAEVFRPLLEPARYRAAFGGRGSGKSRFFGGLMIEEHLAHPGRRSVCVREVQRTLRDSAKRLLEDRLEEYGLGQAQGWRVYNEIIETPGGGIITFAGMADHTAESIKSMEGLDCAWIEEAQTLSARSLSLLRPTMFRTEGSEIWASWNPRRNTDPIDLFFRGDNKPTGASVVRANWDSNPWFPAPLNQERLDDLKNNPDQYAHVWEGDYVTVAAGAYFAAALTVARREGRIGVVAADPLLSFRAFLDIGGTGARADACAIWIAQFVGREVRVIDYYEAIGQPLSAHVGWMLERGYAPHRCHVCLPHDGVTHDRVFDATYDSELRRAGYQVTVVKNQGAGAATKRIESLRRLMPSMRFDESRCKGGLDALGWYHERRDEHRSIGLGPEHDWSSHAADAAGLLATVADEIFTQIERRPVSVRKSNNATAGGWMG